jgi:mannose-6-phosphate isomerase-like protein (cupin superfamily)
MAADGEAPHVRRVVTGNAEDGTAVVLRDERLSLADEPVAPVWAASAPPTVPVRADGEDSDGWFPQPGGSRVVMFTVPPAGAPDGRWSEALQDDGFHSTDTVDTIVVVSGRVWVELDDGNEVELGPGDVLVQNGTRHRWANHGTELPLVAAFIVGARRAP